MIWILDFGSQYTQLIAKKLRRAGFAAEVKSGKSSAALVKGNSQPIAGMILSGSPGSVGGAYDPDPALLELGIPILGLCFGYQFIGSRFGGKLENQSHREYGAALVQKTPEAAADPLLGDLPQSFSVWMSHGDSMVEFPKAAKALLTSNGKPSAFSIPEKKIWALQFHPEVHHTPHGEDILKNFAAKVCGLKGDWNLETELQKLKTELRTQLKGIDEVYCAVSGGVDSSVLAVLLSEFTKVQALYVDHGFQRAYDLTDLQKTFSYFPNISLKVIDAQKNFWAELDGVSDPEKKRKIIGKLFIETFDTHIQSIQQAKGQKIHLAQGTIYSDVIESAANDLAASHKIKSHHNVGGLPEDHNFILVEPLRKFFKDEVREIGQKIGIPPASLHRHPFPGPGLAIRCAGALHPERIEVLRRADNIFIGELKARGLYEKTWQALCVLLPTQAVGVMGDERSYESVLCLRAVSSSDAMTAEATSLSIDVLKEIGSKLVNQVKGINRVLYDLTSKPPATIEWE